MSEFSKEIPVLDFVHLNYVLAKIGMHKQSDQWCLGNRHVEEIPSGKIRDLHTDDSHMLTMLHIKAYFQLECICSIGEKVRNMILDFSLGNFQPYVDRLREVTGEEDVDFDPYEELKYLLTDDGIEDLPDQLERFCELKEYLRLSSIRSKTISEAFSKFFGDGLDMKYLITDSEGNRSLVSESEIDPIVLEDLKLKGEVKRELDAIEDEHCLDNYNAWLAKLRRSITELRPFSEMLPLFKTK